MSLEKKTTRRDFIKKSGIAAGGLIGAGALGGLVGANYFGEDKQKAVLTQEYTKALKYFNNKADFKLVGALAETIFPEDDNGPGAIGLGVPYYIDHQLAGPWGINAKEYMQGPFYDGTETQGFQSRLTRQQIFDLGIKSVNKYTEKQYKKNYVDLEEAEQIEVMEALENGKVDMRGVPSTLFFEELLAVTLEGAYADPLYGGNENMQGWAMKEYPGVQMSYVDDIETEEFLEIEPKSLNDTHGN